ncbi:MAG: hypothetical protein ACXW2T_04580 [Allosphingosinicella sp.]
MGALRLLTFMALALAAPAAFAQPQPRTLVTDAGAPWTHKLTRIVLPATAAGLTRSEVRDGTSEELDVVADYRDPEGDLITTVYVYRTGLPVAAIWFDRAAWAIQSLPQYGLNGAPLPAATPFARPGARAASGLRMAADLPGPELRSTAVAIAPTGDWLVKVRMTSHKLDRAGLDSKLDSLLSALGWPAEPKATYAAAPILPCPRPLKTKQARIVRDDMTQMLMNSVIGISMEREGAPPVYCREPGLPPELGVYRAGADEKSYVIALGDSGLALSVGGALSLDALMGGSSSKSFSMTRLDRNGTSVLPSFNRLPPPQQALSVALGSSPMISTTTRVEAPN